MNEAFYILLFALCGCAIAAWLMSIKMLIDAGRAKGHFQNGGTGKIWFVGIFATPVVAAQCIGALPNLNVQGAPSNIAPEPENDAAPDE